VWGGFAATAAVRAAAIEASSAVDRAGRSAIGAPPHVASVSESKRKRAIDLMIATLAFIALAPLFVSLAIVVILDSGWPPLFSQGRVGLDGRPFRVWKFRTMIRDAESRRGELVAMNEAPFPAFKMRHDPRITRVGRLLRRSSVDELPQLWNVLRGEMSVVGPRPPLPEEVTHYDAAALRRLRARPGITGVWQIENRHRLGGTFEDWVQRDVEYIDRWTLRLDVVLMIKTVRAVARMTGQ
jgi:lipopolysaccharide/colanic/teichoic acid biosynthesis glycosyltransferase